MIPESYRHIIAGLLVRTNQKEVNWQGTVDPSVYIVYFRGFSLAIDKYDDPDRRQELVAVRLYNVKGEPIDSFSTYETEDDYPTLYELWSNARRKALDIDKAIAVMEEEVQTQTPVGQDVKQAKRGSEPGDDIPF
jgi:hypothetical protein